MIVKDWVNTTPGTGWKLDAENTFYDQTGYVETYQPFQTINFPLVPGAVLPSPDFFINLAITNIVK